MLLTQLAERLIPQGVLEDRRTRTLIVAAHGLLHQLPFQALRVEGVPLLEKFTVVYTPSLQAFAELEGAAVRHGRFGAIAAPRDEKSGQSRGYPNSRGYAERLFCGVEEFGERAPRLEYTGEEVRALARGRRRGTTIWWQEEATRERFLEASQRKELVRFGIVHLATHAVIDRGSPHSSKVMLTDRDLTVLDVMGLKLDADLVTLSACESAGADVGPGDELLGLTRAFLYAGARALVASLWQVEDESTAYLMKAFYRNLDHGMPIAEALRAAQLRLHAEGYEPYQWAPFVALRAG